MATWRNRWNPTEAKEQKAYVKWFRLAYRDELLHSIPNHLIRSQAQAMNEYSMGMLAGIPDIFIPAPNARYHGLYVEMKRREGGIVSGAQDSVIARLNHKGYHAIVAQGWHEAMEATQEYFSIPLSLF
jgi:hypothetical protein